MDTQINATLFSVIPMPVTYQTYIRGVPILVMSLLLGIQRCLVGLGKKSK